MADNNTRSRNRRSRTERNTRAARRERARQRRETLAQREGISEDQIALEQRRSVVDTNVTDAGEQEIRQNRAEGSEVLSPADLSVDDEGAGVDVAIPSERQDDVATKVAEQAASQSPLVTTDLVDVDVGQRGIENVEVDEATLEERQEALEQIQETPVFIGGPQGDNDVPTADPELLGQLQKLGDNAGDILADDRSFVGGGAEFSLSIFPTEERIRPNATISFENRQDLRPFLEAVADLPNDALSDLPRGVFNPSEAITRRKQDRQRRRSLRDQLGEAVADAGIDADVDARADGTLIVGDEDSGRTRTARNLQAALQGAAELDEDVRAVDRDGEVGVVDAETPTRDEVRANVASDLGVDREAVDLRDGGVAVDRNALESTVRSSALENVREAQTPVDPQGGDLDVQLDGENVDVREEEVVFEEDARLTPDVSFSDGFEERQRQAVEADLLADLDEQTDVDLDRGDVSFSRQDGQIEAELTEDARQEIRQQESLLSDVDVPDSVGRSREFVGQSTAAQPVDDPLNDAGGGGFNAVEPGEDFPTSLEDVANTDFGEDQVLSTDLPTSTSEAIPIVRQTSRDVVEPVGNLATAAADQTVGASLRRVQDARALISGDFEDITDSQAGQTALAAGAAGIATPEPATTVGGALVAGGAIAGGAALEAARRDEIEVPDREQLTGTQSEVDVEDAEIGGPEVEVGDPRATRAEIQTPADLTAEVTEITTPDQPTQRPAEVDVPAIEAAQLAQQQQAIEEQERRQEQAEEVIGGDEIPIDPFGPVERGGVPDRFIRDDRDAFVFPGESEPVDETAVESIEQAAEPTFQTGAGGVTPRPPASSFGQREQIDSSLPPQQQPRVETDTTAETATRPQSDVGAQPRTQVDVAQNAAVQALPEAVQQPAVTEPAATNEQATETAAETANPTVENTVPGQRTQTRQSRRPRIPRFDDDGGDDEFEGFGQRVLEETFDNAIASVEDFKEAIDEFTGE